jgi:hypothetical protein
LAVVPAFFATVFVREFLAQPLSFFMPGIRRRVFRLQLGFCLWAGLLAMLGMRAEAELAWPDAGAYGAFGLAYAALICIITLESARWGMFFVLLLVFWPTLPLLGARWGAEPWVPGHAGLLLGFGASGLLYLGLRARSRSLHRSLCGRQVDHLADWWSPVRWERMRIRREETRQLVGARPGSPLLAGALAAGRRSGTVTRACQLGWVVLSRSLPQARRLWLPTAKVILCLLVLPYVDSLFAGREAGMRFSGWIIIPAVFCANGMVRLGRRNAILASRADRERAGLLVGFAVVVVTGIVGVGLWACSHALAQVMPAMTIGGRAWTYHLPAGHMAWLALAIAPAQVLSCVARRRPGNHWPAGLGMQLFLLLHLPLLLVRHAVAVPLVAGFALATALAFVVLWHHRCRHGEIVE